MLFSFVKSVSKHMTIVVFEIYSYIFYITLMQCIRLVHSFIPRCPLTSFDYSSVCIVLSHLFNFRPSISNSILFLLRFFFLFQKVCITTIMQFQIILHIHLENILSKAFYCCIPMSRAVLVKWSEDDGQYSFCIHS